MPVVRVQHIGVRSDLRQYRQRGQAEEGEPAGIVRIVRVVGAVDPVAIEEFRMLDQEDLRLAVRLGNPIEPGLLGAESQGDAERPDALEIGSGVAHHPVQRQHHDRRLPGNRLEGGEAVHRLAEPAGARERPVLRGQMDDTDAALSSGRTCGPAAAGFLRRATSRAGYGGLTL